MVDRIRVLDRCTHEGISVRKAVIEKKANARDVDARVVVENRAMPIREENVGEYERTGDRNAWNERAPEPVPRTRSREMCANIERAPRDEDGGCDRKRQETQH